MSDITIPTKENGRTQSDDAQGSGATQSRIDDLMQARISKFSLDALANIAVSFRRKVHLELESV